MGLDFNGKNFTQAGELEKTLQTFVETHDRFPWTTRILCLGHEETLVWVAAIDVEPSVVIADRRSPHIVAMLNFLAPVQVCALILRQYRIVIE